MSTGRISRGQARSWERALTALVLGVAELVTVTLLLVLQVLVAAEQCTHLGGRRASRNGERVNVQVGQGGSGRSDLQRHGGGGTRLHDRGSVVLRSPGVVSLVALEAVDRIVGINETLLVGRQLHDLGDSAGTGCWTGEGVAVDGVVGPDGDLVVDR